MKKYFFPMLLIALFAIGFTASDEDINKPIDPVEPETTETEVTFSADAESDFVFAKNDLIGIFAVAEGAELKGTDNYADNVEYAFNGTNFQSATPIKIKESPLAYYAISPYQSKAANVMTFKAKDDQSAYENFKASNLATAYVEATDAKEVTLSFVPQLSEVAVQFSGDDIDTRTLSVTLNSVLLSADINLNEGTSTGVGDASNVKCYADAEHTFRAIIAPQTLVANEVFMTVTLDGTEIPLTLKEELTFDPGSKLLYSIKVVGDELIVTAGSFGYDKRLDDVVPPEIREKMGEYIPIYTGVNPPNIEGVYLAEPLIGVYIEDYPSWNGSTFTSEVFRFYNQSDKDNTINWSAYSVGGSSSEDGSGAFISGYGNYFTVFLNTEGQLHGVYTKTAKVISGVKTEEGISDLSYAFVMVEKGDDPNGYVMEAGYFRSFKDGDGLSVNTTWNSNSRSMFMDNDTKQLPFAWSGYRTWK